MSRHSKLIDFLQKVKVKLFSKYDTTQLNWKRIKILIYSKRIIVMLQTFKDIQKKL